MNNLIKQKLALLRDIPKRRKQWRANYLYLLNKQQQADNRALIRYLILSKQLT